MKNVNQIIIGGMLEEKPLFLMTRSSLSCCRCKISSNENNFNIVAFGQVASELNECNQGDSIVIIGRLNYNTYQDKNSGQPRKSLQIIISHIVCVERIKGIEQKEIYPDLGAGQQLPDDDIPF